MDNKQIHLAFHMGDETEARNFGKVACSNWVAQLGYGTEDWNHCFKAIHMLLHFAAASLFYLKNITIQ